MSRTIAYTVGEIVLEVLECCSCGAPFAFSQRLMNRQRESGGGHWCPVCGTNQGWGSSYRTQLANTKAELSRAEERARRARQDAEYLERSRNAYRGQVTRLKNRAAAGMCPCCNRHFTNLERHMATKHPDFTEAEG